MIVESEFALCKDATPSLFTAVLNVLITCAEQFPNSLNWFCF